MHFIEEVLGRITGSGCFKNRYKVCHKPLLSAVIMNSNRPEATSADHISAASTVQVAARLR
jgi:hypothetical protein